MKKTLLILGAGASKDVFWYFPTGFELIKEINYHLTTELRKPYKYGEGPCLSSLMNELIRAFADTDHKYIKDAIPQSYLEEKQTKDLFKMVRTLKTQLWDHVLAYEAESSRGKKYNSKTISIDSFFDKISIASDENVKKIIQYALSFLLIGCERALVEKIDNCYEDWIDNNWINELYKHLIKYEVDDIIENLKVINFNYDRSFEFFSERYLKDKGQLSELQKDKFLNNNVCHIYGSLGKLNNIGFGAINNDNTESMKDVYLNFELMYNGRPNIIWNDNSTFDQILFLGFGYDDENTRKLNLNKFKSVIKMGTAINISPQRMNEIETSCGICVSQKKDCKDLICNQTY